MSYVDLKCYGLGILRYPSPEVSCECIFNVSARHENYKFNLNFFTWMVLGVPLSAVLLLLCWLILQLFFIKFRCSTKTSEQGQWIKAMIEKEYAKLQSFSFQEGVVVIHLVLLVGLWLSKDPGNTGGWDSLFKSGYVTDATVALLIGLLLFVIPARRPSFNCGKESNQGTATSSWEGCLTWKMVNESVPWGVIILLGGGFALAEAIEISGLSANVTSLLDTFLKGLPDWALIAVLCSVTTLVTQLTSNMTVATLFLPIIGHLAESNHINPLYLMLPACISTSLAFMLPVSSPSNAIVFATGLLRVIDMVTSGLVLSVIGIFLITLMTMTLGRSYYGLDSFPYYKADNVTTGATTWL